MSQILRDVDIPHMQDIAYFENSWGIDKIELNETAATRDVLEGGDQP